MRDRILPLALVVLSAACSPPAAVPPPGETAPAAAITPADIHARAIVVDSHVDTTQRLFFDKTFESRHPPFQRQHRHPARARRGLDALFFSIWVPSDVTGPTAVKRALQLIDAVHEAVRPHPDRPRPGDDGGRCPPRGGGEKDRGADGDGGRPHDRRRPAAAARLRQLGVRYLTLTHFRNNNWADSSTDKPEHDGLTEFGKEVVRELNRLGMMVDISHVADKTFSDALEMTTVPVIASHSSCRAIARHPAT